jgi:hypothetical protein
MPRTGAVQFDAANTPGNTIIGMGPVGSCTNVVTIEPTDH